MRLKKLFSAVMAMILAVSMLSVPSFAATTIEFSESNIVFDSVAPGYSPVAAKTIRVINNSSSEATGEINLALSGTNASDFTLSTNQITDIVANGNANFTVKPNDSLLAGTYSATITASGTGLTGSVLATVKFKVLPKQETPLAVFAAKGEDSGVLLSVDNTMAYSVDGGSRWVDVTQDNMQISGVTVAHGVQVKKKGVADTSLDSDVQFIGVTQKAQPSGLTPIHETAAGANDGKIDGTDDTMEYKKSTESNWTAITPYTTPLTGLAPATYKVRKKANGTVLASQSVEVVINSGAPTALTGSVDISGDLKFGETLTAIDTGTNAVGPLEYQWKRVNGLLNEDIPSATSRTYVLTADDIGKKLIVTIKDAPGGRTGTIDSASTEEVEKADGPAAPSGLSGVAPTAAGTSDGKITGTTTAMEYKLDSAPGFTPATATETTGLAAGTYKVRVAETSTHKPSSETEVVVPAFTTAAVTITLSQTSEYTFPSKPQGYSVVNQKVITVLNNVAAAPTGILEVVVEGTNPAAFQTESALSSIEPSGFASFGVEPALGLTEGTYTATIKVGSATVPYQQFDVKFVVTAAPTQEAVPSAVFTATSENGGTLSSVDDMMKYSLDGGSSYTNVPSGQTSVTLTGVSETNDIKVIKRGNGSTTTDSDAQTIDVTKAATPSGVDRVNATSASSNDGKLTGTATTMEYRKVPTTTYTSAMATETTGLSSGTYKIRTKASGTVLASDDLEIEINVVPSGATFTGTLTITGTPKFGEVLIANLAGSNATGAVSYSWERSGAVVPASGTTYTLTQDDIGQTIVVKATSVTPAGTIASAATAVVEKADGPAAPSGLSGVAPSAAGTSDGKITGTTAAMEYKLDSAPGFTPATAPETTGLAAGTYKVRVAETSTHKPSSEFTVIVPAFGAPVPATISLDQTAEYEFTAQTEGYSPVTAKTITVTNNSTTATTGALDITLSGTNADKFVVAPTSIADIAASNVATFTVKPMDGLTAGTYTATVKVGSATVAEREFDVKFVVNPASPPAGGGSSSSNHYSSVRPGPVGKVTTPNNDTTSTLKEGASKLSIGSTAIQTMKDGKISTVVMDAAPFISNGRTMVPLRYVAELLGLKVEWLPETKTAKLTDSKTEILVPLTSLTMKVNGKDVQSDVLPVLREARTYLSISNIAKALGLEEGKNIKWNNETKEVIVEK